MTISLLRLLFTLLLVFLNISFASENQLPLGMIDYSRSSTLLEVSKTSPEFTSISLNQPNILIEQRTQNFETYQVFGMQGEPFVFAEGSPTVPQVTRFYRIPNTGSVSLEMVNAEYDLLENTNALPFQEDEKNLDEVNKDLSVYNHDEWFPANVAEISEPMILRDFRVVTVTLHPVQINPVTHQARVYRNLQVNIVANNNPGINEITHIRPPSGAFAPIYRNVLENLDQSTLDDATQTPGSYLIICKQNASALPWADSLAVWKQRKGFKVTIDSRTNWSVATMRTAIQNAYATYDPPLEYVCLIGDPQAAFGVPTSDTEYDHAFALGNSSDDLEDIGVGRLSGDSQTQMATINAKIMAYERNPLMTDTTWYHKGFFYGSTAFQVASNYTLMQWGARQFQNFTCVDSNRVSWHNGAWDCGLVQQQFNSGLAFFFWRGAWIGESSTACIASTDMHNGAKLPICLGIECGTGDFGYGLSLSEAFITAGTPTNLKGGVAGIGCATSGTHAGMNITFTGGFMYAIANLNMESVGLALNSAKLWLPTAFGIGSQPAVNETRWTNLMGDPSLSMWTCVPKEMNVNHPDTLSIGAHHVHLQVQYPDSQPVENALAVLWKGNETYVRGLTDANGEIDFPVNVATAGDMLLTITKRNHNPYLNTIPCRQAEQMIALGSFVLDDDNIAGTSGNADSLVNPDEIIDLQIYLKNYGNTQTGTNISAVITSNNSDITVINPNSNYPDIAPSDSATGLTNFRIHVSPSMQNNSSALLSLTVNASSVTTVSSSSLICHAGNLKHVSHSFSAPLNPGDTRNFLVTLNNDGVVNLLNTNGHLISLDPFVSVEDAEGSFGDINSGSSAQNSAEPFTLHANSLAFKGHVAPMLMVSNSNGFIDSINFTVEIGTRTDSDPAGPDGFGYYAYDNVDSNYNLHPTFSYENISDGRGTNLNINDPGEKISINQIYTVVRRLPFSFQFYGTVYDTITVCSNGWAAFGNQGYYDGFRNYPIPAMQAPDAMMAVFWDDLRTAGNGSGVWAYYDSTNYIYIIQWKAYAGTNYNVFLDFEIILRDPAVYPTADENGQILFQYSTVALNIPGGYAEPVGQCIGIQDARGLIGLPINHQFDHSPGSAFVESGRAILFSTDTQIAYGILQGHVYDSQTNAPLANAQVRLNGLPVSTTTDSAGFYQIPNIIPGVYTVIAELDNYIDGVVSDTAILGNNTLTLDFHLQIIDDANEQNPVIPASYALYQNYPNPFNPSTEIIYEMKETGKMSLKIYNTLGQEVTTLVNSIVTQGRHSVTFNSINLTSGIYFYRMETNNFSYQRKMLLLK